MVCPYVRMPRGFSFTRVGLRPMVTPPKIPLGLVIPAKAGIHLSPDVQWALAFGSALLFRTELLSLAGLDSSQRHRIGGGG